MPSISATQFWPSSGRTSKLFVVFCIRSKREVHCCIAQMCQSHCLFWHYCIQCLILCTYCALAYLGTCIGEAPSTRSGAFDCCVQVVAAELRTEGSKDVVIYKIRVADASGEWTVSRRFRNFETLHRALREMGAYRLRLPAKKIFSQQHSVEFVEDRRQQLDSYLQALLANPVVAGV